MCRTKPPKLKDALLKAAEIAGGGEPNGLVNYLVVQAKQNPGPFMTLLGKVLPTQISGEGEGNIIVEIVKPTQPRVPVVLLAWLAVAQYLGSANAYFATRENAVPTVLFGLLIPLMTAAVGLRLSGSFASLLSAIPLHWIVAAQVYRIGGGIFLVLWADGRLPWQFALPAGIGDVMTGCLAVVVAVLLVQKARRAP